MVVLIILVVFTASFLNALGAVGTGSLVLGSRDAPSGADPAGSALSAETPLLLRQQLLSTISVWHQILARFDFVEILKVRIAEAGLKWSVGRVTLTMLLLGSVSAAIPFAADWPAMTAPLAGAFAAAVPYLHILHKRKQRMQKIEEQFPDALDSLSRALRAGHAFGPGMELVANEAPEPLAQEFRRSCDEWRLGLAWNVALENLARRMPLTEIRLFAAAVILQSRFGGKLNEVLEDLAKTIRDSISLRGDVRAISAQGRMTGTVLTIMPIGLALIMLVTSPAYIGALLWHPYGKYLIAAAMCSLVLGHFAIRRIVSIKV
jgi:tight adherence protein B